MTVRIKDGRKVAGKVVIRPRAEKIAASGQVEIARSKLTHKGGKVTARLKLRYDAALAGKRLKADVIAADIRGAKQVERNAATIRRSRCRTGSASSDIRKEPGARASVPHQPSRTAPSSILCGPLTVTTPRTTTSRPKVTSPSTARRSHATSDGAPPGKRASKSRSSL